MLNIAIKNAPKLFDLFFLYETADVFGIHDLQALGVYWVNIRCVLGEY